MLPTYSFEGEAALGFWQNIGDAFIANLRTGGDASAARREFNRIRDERKGREAEDAARAELDRFIAGKQREYDLWVTTQRAKGNNIPRAVMLQPGSFDGETAVVRYQMNGSQGRMDIFYGGSGNVPMNNDDHGHVVVQDGNIISWELPGPKGRRIRVV